MSSRLIVIGGGKMGAALVAGLLGAGWSSNDLVIIQHGAAKADALRERFTGVIVKESLDTLSLIHI